ncbi:hypothetical protein [Neolewinella agarilytica]|uniref:hypothetical protein n=1 Tax=Neolewinella agarilytica TaxID=478744 RepID=UPI00111443D5|nr:hypothetical protein [Neolewinella agarilytica]
MVSRILIVGFSKSLIGERIGKDLELRRRKFWGGGPRNGGGATLQAASTPDHSGSRTKEIKIESPTRVGLCFGAFLFFNSFICFRLLQLIDSQLITSQSMSLLEESMRILERSEERFGERYESFGICYDEFGRAMSVLEGDRQRMIPFPLFMRELE